MEKPTATTVASTAFCFDTIRGPDGMVLHLDGNGKITASNGTLERPRPNAFSLVQVKDCPGATAACKAACYVHGLEAHARHVHDLYRHNSIEIRRILNGDRRAEWSDLMGDYITEKCGGGFRWHVSGDVFSLRYAMFIAAVVRRSWSVKHWIYTRSLDYVQILSGVSTFRGLNLALNVSADVDNYERAAAVAGQFGARLCYMTRDGEVPSDLPENSVIFPDYGLRGGNPAGEQWFAGLAPRQKAMVCPVDFHGKSEERRCGRCARCLT